MPMHRSCSVGLAIMGLALSGCASGRHRHGVEYDHTTRERAPLTARSLNAEGLRLIEEGDFHAAKKKFQRAIEADLYYVPAHNNLGLVLLREGDYYEAAWQFHCASKMMPRAAEPRANLGLLYENLGRLDRAIDEYEAAIEMDPDNIAAMRHAARAYMKAGEDDDKLKDALETLLSMPDNGQWDYWARGQIIRLGRDK